jgi:5-methyltetrahydropteroyltriglutamate--homocysteine methyltransferase
MSAHRILTTHVGSLPRPAALRQLLLASNQGAAVDPAHFAAVGAQSVADIVKRQREVGIDIVSDGEMMKISYSTYILKRVSGMEMAVGGGSDFRTPDADKFPDFSEARKKFGTGPTSIRKPVCTGAIKYVDDSEARQDIAAFLAALKQSPGKAFMNAASPGVLAVFIANQHYPTEDAYVGALADAMRTEYRLIADAGLTIQVDCPDLAMSRHRFYAGVSEEEFTRILHRNVEMLNHALAGIPAAQVRLHICWGNYPGPHTYDYPVAKLFPALNKANVGAFVFEAANPRHDHEWEDWAGAKLRDDVTLIPGVIDSSCNFVEHPRLVAQRIRRYVDIVGAERVVAGVDCGFGTFALQQPYVFESVAWAKLQALAEGAAIASERVNR